MDFFCSPNSENCEIKKQMKLYVAHIKMCNICEIAFQMLCKYDKKNGNSFSEANYIFRFLGIDDKELKTKKWWSIEMRWSDSFELWMFVAIGSHKRISHFPISWSTHIFGRFAQMQKCWRIKKHYKWLKTAIKDNAAII